MPRAFRFAVASTGARSREEWVAKARRAEALGYDVFLMPDHTGRQLAPVPALLSVADATTTLRIGSFVFANDFRQPLLLAKEVATLDLLSGGRFELGLGAGWNRRDYERLGLPYDKPSVRIDRMLEAIHLLKRLFAGEAVEHAGAHYRAKGAKLAPRSPQRPMPPLLVGGGGPRILAIAAREADIVGIVPQVDAHGRHRISDITSGAMAAKIAVVRRAAKERFERLEIQGFVADVDIGTVGAQAKRLAAAAVDSPYFLYGTAGQVAHDLLRRRERLGITYWPIPDGAMESFAPVLARLRSV